MQDKLVFVISPPRAGSTLLQRMLGAHPSVYTHPEPHLITPIAHLGVYGNVDKAAYDHINAAEAMKSFIEELPRKEDDYLDALRAYTDTLYGRMLAPSGKERFLDKTPAYALVLPFLAKLYPHAKYVVLTRHPLAVFSSFANSFFNGSWADAHAFNPILERYVPAMGEFVRKRPVELHQVAYESLVAAPEAELASMFRYLELPPDPGAVEYGKRGKMKEGMGDPINVNRHDRPVIDSVEAWANELADDPTKLALARAMIDRLSDEDLESWGWPRDRLFEPLERAGTGKIPKTVWNSYTVQRRVMLALKKDIHQRPHGKLLKRLKYYCDVLLRE